jgi:hypothetical protein
MKFAIGLIAGLVLGTVLSVAYAKYEQMTLDAKSVVGYGKFGTEIVKIAVTADGTLISP